MADEFDIRFWNGELIVRLAEWEARMSHWIRTPKAVDGKTGRTVFDLTPWSSWDMCGTKESADNLLMELRRYPNGNDMAVLEIRRHTMDLFVDGVPVAVDRLERALSAALRRHPNI